MRHPFSLCPPKPASFLTSLPYVKPGILFLICTLGRTALRCRLPLGTDLPSALGEAGSCGCSPGSRPAQRRGSGGGGAGNLWVFSSSFSFNNVFWGVTLFLKYFQERPCIMSSLQQFGKGQGCLNGKPGPQRTYMCACGFSNRPHACGRHGVAGRRQLTFPTFGVTITDFL